MGLSVENVMKFIDLNNQHNIIIGLPLNQEGKSQETSS